MATSQAILVDTFPPSQLAVGQALFGMGVIIGPTIGPTLGGYIVDNYDWPWIFYVNVPVGIMASICTILFIHDPERIKNNTPRPLSQIDWLGIFLLILGVGSLQYVLEQGETKDWFDDLSIIIFTVLSVVGLVGFVIRELTARQPIVDLRVITKSRNLAVGAFLSFVLGFGLFSSVFVFPIFTQRILGFTAEQTGLILLPGALMAGFMMPVIGRMVGAGVPIKAMLPVGFTVIFFGFTFWMAAKHFAYRRRKTTSSGRSSRARGRARPDFYAYHHYEPGRPLAGKRRRPGRRPHRHDSPARRLVWGGHCGHLPGADHSKTTASRYATQYLAV